MILTHSEQKQLLQVAFRAIESVVTGKPDIRPNTGELYPGLIKPGGAFVSLYVSGKLRGCIGTFSESEALHQNVRQMAVASATTDSRFPSIKEEELKELDMEISVLGPREPVSRPEDVIIGKHGIYMVQGHRRGTLLPQVALQQNWNAPDFLRHCAEYKAGIGPDGWKQAELFVFEAQVIKS